MAALRVCIVLASCCVALSVAADESTGWRALYRDGSRQYDLGDFRAALDSFKRAYLAHEEAGILFDIGECHRQLGESTEAVHAYQSYLRRKPDAANRADIEALIAKLQGAPAPPAAAPAAAPKPSAPPPAPTPPAATTPPPAPAVPAATAPSPATSAPTPPAPVAAHGSVYNPWGATASAAPPPPAAASSPAEPASTATAPAAAAVPAASAPEATPLTTPPAWSPTAVEMAPPRKKSRAWIAAIVVPAVAVLAVSIGVTAWYFSPAPTYTKVGPAQ